MGWANVWRWCSGRRSAGNVLAFGTDFAEEVGLKTNTEEDAMTDVTTQREEPAAPIPTEVPLEPAPPPVFPGEGAVDRPIPAPAQGSPLGDYTRELQQEFEEQEEVGKV
jgi:hypothetical protein